MIVTFEMSTLPPEPEARRKMLLRVKKSAKAAGHKVTVWLDARGLHVQGTSAMLKAVAAALPSGG